MSNSRQAFSLYVQSASKCCIPTYKYKRKIIKHNLRTSMNERTHFFIKNISLTLYSQKGWCFCGVWEIGGETYTQREDFFFQYLVPGAKGCHLLASSSETPLIGCVSLARLRFSALCLNLTAWFSPRDPLSVTHLFDLSALTRFHLPVN